MAVPLDKLYLENLDEFIFDDTKFVSYKWLSCKLGVHMNIAKQMLYHYMTLHEAKGSKKRLHTMYYLSGMAPQKWIDSIDEYGTNKDEKDKTAELNSEGEENANNSPDMFPEVTFPASEEEVHEESLYEGDAFIVMICQDTELENFKKNFTQIYSIHVYGLSAFLMTRNKLNEFVRVPIYDDEGRNPVHYGSVSCKAALTFRPHPTHAAKIKDILEMKARMAVEKAKYEKEMEEKEKEKQDKLREKQNASSSAKSKMYVEESKSSFLGLTTTTNKTTKKDKDKPATAAAGNNKDRLKNLFAAAAAKPKKPVVEPKKKTDETPKKVFGSSDEDDEDEPVTKAKPKPSTSSKSWASKRKETAAAAASAKNKKKASETRKRKRIRDPLSSSDDEESDTDKKKMSEEEETLPESPVPKKYLQKIQSDSESDDDFKETNKKKVRHSSSGDDKKVEKSSSGKKRFCKTVHKRHVDEDGYFVTVMEQVMVSESDHSEGEDQVKNKKQNDSDEVEVVPEKIVQKKPETKTIPSTSNAPKPAPKKGGKNSKKPTGKQASITSFFQKK